MPDTEELVSRDIGNEEYFVRIIKFPFNFKDSKPEKAIIERLSTKGIFIPAANRETNTLDGVSLDRIAYCSLLNSKSRALDNFGMSPKGIPVYIGMAIISHKHIMEINTIPITDMIASPIDEHEEESEISLIDLKNDIAKLLEGFDISCLEQYKYFGIIATPVDSAIPSNRIPPPQKVCINDLGNPSHAEIFYLQTDAEPNNPNATIIHFISRKLQQLASKAIDPDTTSRSTIPELPLPE